MKIKISILLITLVVGFIACDSEVKNKNDKTKTVEAVQTIEAAAAVDAVDAVDAISKEDIEPTDEGTNISNNTVEEGDKIIINKSNDLRPHQPISFKIEYTDTIEFLAYDDDYDYRMLMGKKNEKEVSFIYNWDWMEDEKYNFKEGELVKVTWKMDSIPQAGDEDVIWIKEWAKDAERILSENKSANAALINSQKSELSKEIIAQKNKPHKTIKYFEFKPDKIQDFKMDKFENAKTYQFDSKKIVTGYDNDANPDIEKDWGYKLLLLNNENEILFKSYGVGDVYLFEPHFYKNIETEKIIIICQLGFEYYFGGEAFVYDNGKITAIGMLDLESDNHEKGLTDIVEINEKDNEIVFTFNSDSLILEPGSEDILIKNIGVKYIYKNKELILIK